MTQWLNDLFVWLTSNATALSIVGASIAALFPLIQYVLVKKSEDRKHTFEAYHRLIGDLVDPPTPRLDRQIAVVYELRNFKTYFPVTARILKGVKAAWMEDTEKDLTRIYREIDLTLEFIKMNSPRSVENNQQ